MFWIVFFLLFYKWELKILQDICFFYNSIKLMDFDKYLFLACKNCCLQGKVLIKNDGGQNYSFGNGEPYSFAPIKS